MGLFDLFKKKPSQSTPNAKREEIESPPSSSVSISSTSQSQGVNGEATVIPVEQRIKTAIVSKQGLYPHEILALEYATSFYTSDNQFQGFWWYKYGVNDVQALLNSLVDRGFLAIGSLEASLNKQTSTAIKEVLKLHSLKLTGKKADLIQRALSEVPEAELCKQFPRRTYELTESGKEAIQSEEYVLYIHRHPYENLDIWSLNQMVYAKPYYPYRDKIWGFFNKRCGEYAMSGDWGLYRNCRFSMNRFLQEEGKYKDALGMLAEVVYYDLSGMSNGFDMQYLYISAPHFFPYEDSLATTAPGVIGDIFSCQEKASLSEDGLTQILSDRMRKLSAPLTLFTVDECIQIIWFERSEDKESLSKLYEKARKRFQQKYPKIDLRRNA